MDKPITIYVHDTETKERTGTFYEKMEDVSDGYHTFKQLYEFRLLYNAALFNELYRTHQEYDIHKSWQHSDGELAFGGGWFVVVAQLPTGQITNHYQEDDWPLFDIERRDTAAEWDGHTAEDAAKRLRAYVESYESLAKRGANTMPTTTIQTWKRCLHKNGWYMTAHILWFKKEYFVCSDCGQSMEKRMHELFKGHPTSSPEDTP